MADSSSLPPAAYQPSPLGATWDGEGTRFALLSRPATAAWLCLFDAQGREEIERLPLERAADNSEPTTGLWERTVPGVGPGQIYGFRVDQPHSPSQLLFDPYARDYLPQQSGTPLAQVVDSRFSWGAEGHETALWRKTVPWQETIIYELHVKGMTALAPQVPEHLRGTYLGLVEPCVLDHLRGLGVTAVELLPIFFSLTEDRLRRLGLSNYWGYNTLGFFAPDRRFCATDDPVREVKTMVQAFHRAGLEVILDVAYNHTAEGGQEGPTLSLKGLDKAAYYRFRDEDPEQFENFSGCGNTLDARSPTARRLVLDSLRYWAGEMRIDGFRFDLAPTLGRTGGGFSATAPFFQELQRDPLLKGCKLVAEPWDLGPGGYRLGGFPAPWREWNDRYRDVVRSFWRGDGGRAPELAKRLTGSTDLFPAEGSRPINFVTCHDGFTLRDLVSYEEKHNQANGEDGRDGHSHNLSSNGGVEGSTDDPEIRRHRARLQRAFIATLALSRGVPMISHGDELSRTQKGNNNAYCQDGPVSWMHWQPPEDEDLRRFWAEALRLRSSLEHFPRERVEASLWLDTNGHPLDANAWRSPDLRAFGWWLDSALLLFNASPEAQVFRLPEPESRQWRIALESASSTEGGSGNSLAVAGQSLTVLRSDRLG